MPAIAAVLGLAVLVLAQSAAAAPRYRLEADTASYQVTTRDILLTGGVVLEREGGEGEPAVRLRADTVAGRIDGVVEAEGHVRIEREGFEADAVRGVYDFATATGHFEGIRLDQDSWYGTAGRAALRGPGQYQIEDLRFTACDESPPHYHFRIGRAAWSGGLLRLWGARMFIGRIPVFWWPYLSLTAGKKPPFEVSAGKSGYEGYFVKTRYPLVLGRLGQGQLKLDWRSRRGWGYGIEHTVPLRRGNLGIDLYRIDERDRGGRGIARFRYAQDWTDRWRALGDYQYVTDGRFLQDYRFADFVSNPDPVSTGSIAYRGDRGAAVLRVVGNANRDEYTLVERLPELRAAVWPHALPGGLYADADAGLTVFRHAHPYDSGAAANFARQHPQYGLGSHLVRGDLHAAVRRPMAGPLGWRLTPYAGVDVIGWSEDSRAADVTARTLPYGGITAARFYRAPLGRDLSWSFRPELDLRDRSLHGQGTAGAPIIEHIDRERDDRRLRIVLDQGLLARRDGGWIERIRLRLDGGIDFDRVADERYLPVAAKVVALLGAATHIDGALTYDPNRSFVRDGRLEVSHVVGELRGSAGYFVRRGDFGVPDQENASASLDARITRGAASVRPGLDQGWLAGAGGSYDVERGRLDYARFTVRRVLHDWILSAELTDQRATRRTDFKLSAELLLP